MKNVYIEITVNDPYPKKDGRTGKGTTLETAIARALREFRREKWARRPLREVRIYAKVI